MLPFANIVSIPALNVFTGRPFVGASASVVFATPFLRYFSILGCTSVGKKDLTKAIFTDGLCVGLVPDGLKGIFSQNESDEVVNLKHSKGLAKFSLINGVPLFPAYSVGNTSVFSAWYDRWGIMKVSERDEDKDKDE